MRGRFVWRMALLLGLGWSSPSMAAQSAPMILALGNAGFLNPSAVQAKTGAEVKQELGKDQIKDFAVLVLANAAYGSLPGPVRQGLTDYVTQGGAVLLTGGSQAFGSGGYREVASILPFRIRADSDWRATPFRSPVPLQPGHPILAGVDFIPIGNINDMNPRADAAEILQAAGGGSAAGGGGGGSYPYPLIAEVAVGAGRVLGIAFDLNELGGMRSRDLFVQNILAYLLSVSRLGQPR